MAKTSKIPEDGEFTVNESLRVRLKKCADFWDEQLGKLHQNGLLTKDWRPNYEEMADELISLRLWPGKVAKKASPSRQKDKDFVKFGNNYFEIRSISLLADSVTSTLRSPDTRNLSAEPFNRIEDLVREVLHEPIQKWIAKANTDAEESARVRADIEFGQVLSGITSDPVVLRECTRRMAELRQEEINGVRRDDPDALLKVYYSYEAGQDAFGEWRLHGTDNRKLRDDFTTVARESGIAIGCPAETDPLGYWLHSVLLGILRERSNRFKGGLIGDRRAGLLASVLRSSDEHWSLLNAEIPRMAILRGSEPIPAANIADVGTQPVRNSPSPEATGIAGGPNRRRQVEDYREECRRAGKPITKTDIWKSAGYRSRTEFERWERNDPRVNKVANERFSKILAQKPHLK